MSTSGNVQASGARANVPTRHKYTALVKLKRDELWRKYKKNSSLTSQQPPLTPPGPSATGTGPQPQQDAEQLCRIVGVKRVKNLLSLDIVDQNGEYKYYEDHWQDKGKKLVERDIQEALRRKRLQREWGSVIFHHYELRRDPTVPTKPIPVIHIVVKKEARAAAEQIHRYFKNLYDKRKLDPFSIGGSGTRTNFYVEIYDYKIDADTDPDMNLPLSGDDPLPEDSGYFALTVVWDGGTYESLRTIYVLERDRKSFREATMGHIHINGLMEGITVAHIFEEFTDSKSGDEAVPTIWSHPILTYKETLERRPRLGLAETLNSSSEAFINPQSGRRCRVVVVGELDYKLSSKGPWPAVSPRNLPDVAVIRLSVEYLQLMAELQSSQPYQRYQAIRDPRGYPLDLVLRFTDTTGEERRRPKYGQTLPSEGRISANGDSSIWHSVLVASFGEKDPLDMLCKGDSGAWIFASASSDEPDSVVGVYFGRFAHSFFGYIMPITNILELLPSASLNPVEFSAASAPASDVSMTWAALDSAESHMDQLIDRNPGSSDEGPFAAQRLEDSHFSPTSRAWEIIRSVGESFESPPPLPDTSWVLVPATNRSSLSDSDYASYSSSPEGDVIRTFPYRLTARAHSGLPDHHHQSVGDTYDADNDEDEGVDFESELDLRGRIHVEETVSFIKTISKDFEHNLFD